jgi:hypothetical protein
MKSKQQNNIYGISKTKFMVFSATKYLHLFPYSQNYVSMNEMFFLELPSLGSPKSHQHD